VTSLLFIRATGKQWPSYSLLELPGNSGLSFLWDLLGNICYGFVEPQRQSFSPGNCETGTGEAGKYLILILMKYEINYWGRDIE
jgi:hypothetical protein